MRSGVDKAAGEDGGKQVTKSVALLKHAGDDATGGYWTIFESSSGGITVKTCRTVNAAAQFRYNRAL